MYRRHLSNDFLNISETIQNVDLNVFKTYLKFIQIRKVYTHRQLDLSIWHFFLSVQISEEKWDILYMRAVCMYILNKFISAQHIYGLWIILNIILNILLYTLVVHQQIKKINIDNNLYVVFFLITEFSTTWILCFWNKKITLEVSFIIYWYLKIEQNNLEASLQKWNNLSDGSTVVLRLLIRRTDVH